MSERVAMGAHGLVTLFLDDATAELPTWVLASSLWHFTARSGIALCGFIPFHLSKWNVVQHFRPHTKRKMFERTVTTLCPKCLRLTDRGGPK